MVFRSLGRVCVWVPHGIHFSPLPLPPERSVRTMGGERSWAKQVALLEISDAGVPFSDRGFRAFLEPFCFLVSLERGGCAAETVAESSQGVMLQLAVRRPEPPDLPREDSLGLSVEGEPALLMRFRQEFQLHLSPRVVYL